MTKVDTYFGRLNIMTIWSLTSRKDLCSWSWQVCWVSEEWCSLCIFAGQGGKKTQDMLFIFPRKWEGMNIEEIDPRSVLLFRFAIFNKCLVTFVGKMVLYLASYENESEFAREKLMLVCRFHPWSSFIPLIKGPFLGMQNACRCRFLLKEFFIWLRGISLSTLDFIFWGRWDDQIG